MSLRVIAAAALVIGSASAIYFVMRPRPVSIELAAQSSIVSPQHHRELLRQAPSVEFDQVEAITSSLRETIEAPASEPDRLTPRNREALERTLYAYIEAFASDSAGKYMQLLDTQAVGWIPFDAPEWSMIDFAMQHVHKRPADRSKPRETLESLLQHHRFTEAQHPFRQVAIGPRGMRTIVEFGRTRSDIERPLIFERSGIDEQDYWNKGGRHGIRLHLPAVSADKVLAKHKGILFAQATVQFRIVRDGPAIWHSTWFWNPDSEVWTNHSMALESYYGLGLFY